MQDNVNLERKTKLATGSDTPVMVAVLTGVGLCLAYLFFPFFTIPELEYGGLNGDFKIWDFASSLPLIQERLLRSQPFSYPESAVRIFCQVLIGVAVIHMVLLLSFSWYAYRHQGKAIPLGRVAFGFSLIPAAMTLAFSFFINMRINDATMTPNTFWNLTAFSRLVPTAMPYLLIFLAVVMCIFMRRLLDTGKEEYAVPKSPERKNGFSKRTKIAALIIILLIPMLIAFGLVFLKDRSYYFISICIVICAMIPFFMVFENRKPQAKEIIVISVLVVIASAGRAAFFMLPHFKPVAALVIIAGIGLGAEAGFLTGAMTGFVSNFFAGQGPWTPWQMFAFGIIGFLAGLIFRGEGKGPARRFAVCAFGGLATLVIYGFIMDTSSALSFLDGLTWEAFLARYISGFPLNCIHGFSTVVFLFFLERPMLKKIRRVREKYGMIAE